MNKKNWILILGKNVNKEQINGLEAIGSIVTEDGNEESTPMDESGVKNDDTTASDDSKKVETEDKLDDTIDTDSSITENTDSENDVNDNEDTDGEDSSTIDGDNPENSDEINPEDTSLDNNSSDTNRNPNFVQERRILLSNKLLKLYDSITDSINYIINSPSFENKPVILNELTDLSNIVDTINESINNESDHTKVLLKYALCVKTFNRIMNSI